MTVVCRATESLSFAVAPPVARRSAAMRRMAIMAAASYGFRRVSDLMAVAKIGIRSRLHVSTARAAAAVGRLTPPVATAAAALVASGLRSSRAAQHQQDLTLPTPNRREDKREATWRFPTAVWVLLSL